MAQKALSLFKNAAFAVFLITFTQCYTKNTEGVSDVGRVMSDVGASPKSDIPNAKYTEGGNILSPSVSVDTSMIPMDTISSMDKGLTLDNGIYHVNSKPYSGYIKEIYENGRTSRVMSLANGRQHGIARTFFPNGEIQDIRSYKANKSYGRHYGYWENGHLKFDFVYINDKREGYNKQWYRTGKPYAFLNFKDDREDGMQQAWRENGKIYINYEAKDGFRYGLQKSALCYTLINEKLKLK